MNMTKMITMKMNIKGKVTTTMHKYQKMEDCVLNIIAMIMIRISNDNQQYYNDSPGN